MCLDITKQYYVFLRSLKDSGTENLRWTELSDEMEALSKKHFGTPLYSSFPTPLLSLIKNASEIGEIIGIDGRYRIDSRGVANLKFIEKNFVTPFKRHRQLTPVLA
jgi:hypothetical protein